MLLKEFSVLDGTGKESAANSYTQASQIAANLAKNNVQAIILVRVSYDTTRSIKTSNK